MIFNSFSYAKKSGQNGFIGGGAFKAPPKLISFPLHSFKNRMYFRAHTIYNHFTLSGNFLTIMKLPFASLVRSVRE